MPYSVYVFDAYGTLFDVHAAVRKHASAALGPDAQAFSDLWRQKQLEYSWQRSLMGRYKDFWSLTEAALDHAFARFPQADRALRTRLLDAYWSCDCYPEIPMALKALKERGARLAILSNGTRDMLAAACASAAIADAFDQVISVDEIRVYKPDPRVYELVETHFRVFPENVSFQSSNRWDVAGATAYGFRSVWINRTNAPDEYTDFPPAAVLPDLGGLVALV